MDDPVTETFPHLCHRCGCTLRAGEASFYVVRIEAFADPTPPGADGAEASDDVTAELNELIAQAAKLSEQELMDQVYRRLTMLLCNGCYQQWIEDPAG